MNRVEERCQAAGAAASICHRLYLSYSDDPTTALYRAQAEMAEQLALYVRKPFRRAVAGLVEDAREEEGNRRMGFLDPVDPDERDRRVADRTHAEALIGELQRAIRELQELRSHRCDWQEDPESGDLACGVCGACRSSDPSPPPPKSR